MANRERTPGTGVRHRATSLTRTMSAPLAHIALALAPGIGRFRFNNLVEHFGSADAVLSASRKELGVVPGMGPAATAAVRAVRLDRAKEVMTASKRLESSVLLPCSDDFPTALRNIPDTPVLLFARGDLTLLQKPAVAVVGSRVHTKYGQEACERLTNALAQAGLVVVSGMARGLDAIAHWAAFNSGGASIGVLGNGHGVVYPVVNRTLYQRMLEGGCLLTEHPPGQRPTAGSFPQRNRVISGLARVTLVVEARKNSGALITAESALEQGREVMAVPGPITGSLSVGTNRLIQMGAKPVVDARDVLEEYGIDPKLPQVTLPSNLTEAECRVIELLDNGLSHVDDLASHANAEVSDLLPILTALEIRGLISQRSGMQYGRIAFPGNPR